MDKMPHDVNELLKEYFNLFESKLPNFIEGYYIYGSVSLGAFTYGFSDIDFIAVVKRKATDLDINFLKEIHSDIKKKFPKLNPPTTVEVGESFFIRKFAIIVNLII